jgi:F-type H+-transporting ATPase subunit a
MEGHYTYLTSLGIHDANTQKIVTSVVFSLALLLIGSKSAKVLARRRALRGEHEGAIPEEKITTSGLFDFFIESFVAFQDSILGKENRKYLPVTGTVFLYVLVLNIVGLIPGVPAATTSVWTTVPVALFIFISFNYYGIKEHGVVHYFKHFLGPVWWLAWFILPLELFGTVLRILTLNLRLYWNISADHLVLGIFTDLVPYLVPVIFFALGTFVCFMQAFVPTVLTMIYIMLATSHEEGTEQHQH